MDSNARHIAPAAANRQHIANNTCYALSFELTKNRIYYSILGYWKNQEGIPDFLADWDKILQLVDSGFDLLVDMRTMLTHPQELNSLHEEAFQKVRIGRVSRIANVMPLDRIASLQVTEIIKKVNLPSQNFETCEAAEQWLDETIA